jgi:GTP-binding protein EngB required for normal cell division
MDLKEYERAKFELAALLRSATPAHDAGRSDLSRAFGDLFTRLAEDRFNLVVVGRFNRGKTSVMNAMLGTERLPTGVVPLTSVITTVSYGSRECVFIDHQGNSLPETIALDSLPDYVTQRGNPGNVRRVAVARVELPAEFLRRGFHFVDTPGLGSSIIENTRTTERFLPEADAFVLVTSYDSPLSEEELRLLQGLGPSAGRTFLVVNKHDMLSPEERAEVLCHIREQVEQFSGGPRPQIFSVSAHQGLEANRTQDSNKWAESGLQAFQQELTRFLVDEKQAEFLLRMCDRVEVLLRDAGNADAAAERLRSLRREVMRHRSTDAVSEVAPAVQTAAPASRFSSCEICGRIERAVYDFLCRYQYDISVRPEARRSLADHGGLCAFHTWHYDAMASPRGTCLGFPDTLERAADRLRRIAALAGTAGLSEELAKLQPTPQSCVVCRVHKEAEDAAVTEFVGRLANGQASASRPVLCLSHLRLVAHAVADEDLAKRLLVAEAEALERIVEDMHRYVLKCDGTRRFLVSGEEDSAHHRALLSLAGHRNVNAPWQQN